MIGARPSDGSSSSNSFGRDISPRAIATICCWPPERVQPSAFSNGLISGKMPNIFSASASSSARAGRARFEPPRMMFSRTVRPGNTRRPSGTWATPSFTIAPGDRPPMRPPGKAQRSGLRRHQAGDHPQRRALAGAVGAQQGDDLAFLDGEAQALESQDVPVGGDHVFELKERHETSTGLGAPRPDRPR